MTTERFHAPLDPAVAGLLHLSPSPGTACPVVDRLHWLEALTAAIEAAYTDQPAQVEARLGARRN